MQQVANFILEHMRTTADIKLIKKNLIACIVALAIGDIFPASVEIKN